ncbi:carbohydrate-binding protein [Flavivirga jejuensis]|nr:carbohydrate-binding protein [Flavivirga jejuensis]
MYKSNFKNQIGFFIMMAVFMTSFYSGNSQTLVSVNSLSAFRTAVQNSNQEIVLEAGEYYLEDLPSELRVITCSGSNNIIDLTGARINALVGSIRTTYFIISGDNNELKNGIIEDYYKSGHTDDITDYSAYNNDPDLSYGLRGAALVSVRGNDNLVVGLKLVVRGSRYGYGSIYGIGSDHTFSIDKRCALNIGGGLRNTLDGIIVHHNAFGHAIFIQNGGGETTVKNCYIEGRMRLSADLYNETNSYDLPFRSNYQIAAPGTPFAWPLESPIPIPLDVMYPLSEDGIRSYGGTGSITVENCTVKHMRGGIRTYLASSATVTNCTSIGNGLTNYNVNNGGKVIKSKGDFSFAPIMDVPLNRSGQNIELTIMPSPDAIGPHNIANIDGNNHNIVFHRTEGPLDSDEERAIVISGSNSTIVNETEYAIILEATASGNTIVSCGPVTDNGVSNSIFDCNEAPNICGSYDPFLTIQAAHYCSQSGIQAVGSNSVGYINSGDWVKYDNIDFSVGANSIEILAASKNSGGNIEIREGSNTGTLLGTVAISNTGSFTSWQTFKENINITSGIKDIYFVFTGGGGYLFDVNSFKFSSSFLTVSDLNSDLSNKPMIYPNLVSSTTTIVKATNSTLSIYDINGRKIFTQVVLNDNEILDLSSLPKGIYFAYINSTSYNGVIKLIKK